MKYIVSLDMVTLLQIFSATHSLTFPKSECITGLIFRLQPLVDCFNQTGQYLQSSKVIYVFLGRELTEANRVSLVYIKFSWNLNQDWIHLLWTSFFLNPEIRLKLSPVNIKFLYWCTQDFYFWCTPDFDEHQRILYGNQIKYFPIYYKYNLSIFFSFFVITIITIFFCLTRIKALQRKICIYNYIVA